MGNPAMHRKPQHGWPATNAKAMGFVVVLALHGLVIWALNAGLGRKLLESAPVVVFAQMVSEMRPAPVPPPTPPKVVAAPKAVVAPMPAPVPTRQVPVADPTPVVPAPTSVIAAPPPAAPMPQAPVAAAVVAPVVAAPVPVRVAAHLQASGTCQKPEYPALSRRREEQGSVMLKFLIGVDGSVLESQIAQSSGFARLDEAARAALVKCQFKPGSVDGKAEASWASLKYTWRLD